MVKHFTNEKALGLQSEGSKENSTNAFDSTANTAQMELNLQPPKRKYSGKSTVNQAQYDRVDRAFDYPEKLISTIDFRRLGVIHPSGRIKEMNERLGYRIEAVDLRTVVDDQGFAHPRIAFYALFERPTEGGAAQ